MERNFTDDDIRALVEAIRNDVGHTCRFDRVKAEDLEEAITFYKNFNKVINEGKSTARKTLVAIVVTFAAGVTVVGFVSKIKDAIIKP